MDINLIATFALLVGLEIVLGIDNILLISILTDRIPKEQRRTARLFGLGLALLGRLGLLFGASYLVKLNTPVLFSLSWKGILLIAGGGFLLFKAVREIHHVVEHKNEEQNSHKFSSLTSVIMQILLLDIIFSLDSIITAVGLTENLYVIYASVLVSFLLVLFFAGPISEFVHKHVTLKILALSFLVTIGVTLAIEGMGGHVPKGYIYLPMGFALMVEFLQMRFSYNQEKLRQTR